MISRIILFLSLFTATSFIQTARTPFNPNPRIYDTEEIQQLDKQRKTFKTRGIVLLATSPVVLGAGLFSSVYGVVQCGLYGNPVVFGAIAYLGLGAMIGSFVMIGFGIADLVKASAHKKLIKRLRLQEEAQERKRLRGILTFQNAA